jgi:hypothetical protein
MCVFMIDKNESSAGMLEDVLDLRRSKASVDWEDRCSGSHNAVMSIYGF